MILFSRIFLLIFSLIQENSTSSKYLRAFSTIFLEKKVNTEGLKITAPLCIVKVNKSQRVQK